MTAEEKELETNLRAIWGEQHPTYPNPQMKNFSDELLTLGVFFQRQLDMLRHPVKYLPTGFAVGITPMPTARFKPKRKIKE